METIDNSIYSPTPRLVSRAVEVRDDKKMLASVISTVFSPLERFDEYIGAVLGSHAITAGLISTPTSRYITTVLILTFLVVVGYETLYWSGIYLNLWEYHAKDIFTEIPIHCAHVYVRVNLIDKQDEERANNYYELKRNYKHHNTRTLQDLKNWNKINSIGDEIFKLKRSVTYHFEFSPEDFEMNDEPEYGSNIGHLRKKILSVFNESDVYNAYKNDKEQELTNTEQVLIYNSVNEYIPFTDDSQYLSKSKIETGQTIDTVIIL